LQHTVSLRWTGSTSTNVAGYNIYRATTSGGPYTKVNSAPIVGVSYLDIAVQAGQTYYYRTTAVDGNNNESGYSNTAAAVVPTS
jgi:fibronectin type 3 domain-containing protein